MNDVDNQQNLEKTLARGQVNEVRALYDRVVLDLKAGKLEKYGNRTLYPRCLVLSFNLNSKSYLLLFLNDR